MTGHVPFHLEKAPSVILLSFNGKRPPRPTDSEVTDDLWTLIERCWRQDAESRPDCSEILEALQNILRKPPIVLTDEGVDARHNASDFHHERTSSLSVESIISPETALDNVAPSSIENHALELSSNLIDTEDVQALARTPSGELSPSAPHHPSHKSENSQPEIEQKEQDENTPSRPSRPPQARWRKKFRRLGSDIIYVTSGIRPPN